MSWHCDRACLICTFVTFFKEPSGSILPLLYSVGRGIQTLCRHEYFWADLNRNVAVSLPWIFVKFAEAVLGKNRIQPKAAHHWLYMKYQLGFDPWPAPCFINLNHLDSLDKTGFHVNYTPRQTGLVLNLLLDRKCNSIGRVRAYYTQGPWVDPQLWVWWCTLINQALRREQGGSEMRLSLRSV